MDLNKLKTGKEFIVYWFEGKKAYCDVYKWIDSEQSFFIKDEDGDFIEYAYDDFNKHTTIVTE